MAWSLTSDAFQNDAEIPRKYTCDADGDDVSPPLKWGQPPEGAKELALICDDPDAPIGTFDHWVIWGMPAALPDLPEAVPKLENPPAVGGAKQGKNGFGKIGYGGPCPPRGKPHHYHFRLYALDTAIDLKPGSTKADLLKAMEGHIIGHAELVGLYARR
jgi:Raf kinase inhibitor-like YbhB/YbcL family protein